MHSEYIVTQGLIYIHHVGYRKTSSLFQCKLEHMGSLGVALLHLTFLAMIDS